MAIQGLQNIAEADIMVHLYSWYLCVRAIEGTFSIIVPRISVSISELCSIAIWQQFYSGFSILATESSMELKERQWPSENRKSADWDHAVSLNFMKNIETYVKKL